MKFIAVPAIAVAATATLADMGLEGLPEALNERAPGSD